MKSINDYEEGDIIEPEEWRNPEEQAFNHQSLVMSAMKKCLELGSKELREGYWNEKVDRQGNIHRTWVEDSRKSFIEAVKSLLMVVECDYDEDAKKNINDLIEKVKDCKDHWLDQEWKWWTSLNQAQQRSLIQAGKQVQKGFFNQRLEFDNYYYAELIDIYRTICTEVNKLTYRLDFYGEISYAG